MGKLFTLIFLVVFCSGQLFCQLKDSILIDCQSIHIDPNLIVYDDSSSYSVDSNEVFLTYDVKPKFPGGIDSLYQYVRIKLGPKFHDRDIKNRVYIAFVIDKNGRSKDISAVKGKDRDLISSICKILSNMPHWEPGQANGRNVDVRLTLQFSF